jgi:3-deoxy-D-manno-octulosonic-acid transferase
MTLSLAQTAADAERLLAMGAPTVEVAGNLKYDVAVDASLLAQGRAWASAVARPVVMLAVSREGEEAMLLSGWRELPAPRPVLLIVPRHPQRFDEVAALVTGAGLSLSRRSAWAGGPPPDSVDVWLGDTMREMPLYYGLSTVALLGGSFAPLGGQNLIEAAACGCPMLTGPSTFNFAEAAALAVEAGAAERLDDLPSALQRAVALCGDGPARQRMVHSSLSFAAQHRGAARATAQRILQLPASE